MSERMEFEPDEMPSIKLNLGEDREFIATPYNTTLFTFLGRLACYDHIFMQTGDEDDQTMTGTYVFNMHPCYEDIASFMLENSFPMLLNRVETPDCDIAAWNRMVAQQTADLDEGVPEGWV